MNDDAVSQAIVKLFDTEWFYAELTASMRRVIGDRVPIAGVCIKDSIELHINPKTFNDLPLTERVAIIKHECEHILRDHIGRSKEIAPEVYIDAKVDDAASIINQMKHQSINIAADCAINGGIPGLPVDSVFPETFKLPDGNTMEWYLNALKDNEEAKKFMNFDDHPLWAESDSDNEALREKVRQAIKEAATRTRNAGRMTYNDELLVSKFLDASVSWQAQLKRFAAKNTEVLLDTSKKKRNRRYGIMYPGSVKKELLHLGVAIDTSGSVSDEALVQFLSEINKISKYAKITVVEADSEIKNSYEFNPRKQYKVKGRGGTAYQPAFDFFNKIGSIDGLIYFGDMDCYDQEEIKKPKYPVLWAIIGSQKPPTSFGAQITIKI